MASIAIPAYATSFSGSTKDAPPQSHTTYSFDQLVDDIKDTLGNHGGIDDKHVDPDVLIALMSKYTSNPTDWLPYTRNDPSKNYTRNLVVNISGRANLLVLVWNPGKGSPIHDHANAHCIMKILEGELDESVYHIPTSSEPNAPLDVKQSTRYKTDQVAYISDNIGLHRVMNPQADRVSVSLHLYTPPNAADFGYNIYDRQTGKRTFVQQA